MNIFPEVSADFDAISALLESAFGRPQEARLVETLRKTGRLAVALAGFDRGGMLAGYAAMTAVSLDDSRIQALGLGPVAVLPRKQRRGFGGALIRAALRRAKESGYGAVFVLGDPRFYGRFGFERASGRGLACSELNASGENFLVLELIPGTLEAARGKVRYAP